MNVSNARCFDKSIYLCHPGIIVGMVSAIVIGSAFLYYMCVSLRNSKVSQRISLHPTCQNEASHSLRLIAIWSVPSELIRMSFCATQEWRDELAYKIWRMKERMRSRRRPKNVATTYNQKRDVELATVDTNDDPPEDAEPALAGSNDNSKTAKDTTSAPQAVDKPPESQDDTNSSPAGRDVEHDGAPLAATKSHHVHFGNPP